MNHTIHAGDCTTVKPDGLFHAVLCDPPYELGFMGKDWDASGVAFNPDTWRKIGESLHPGGFLMAFASSRGWHRLACAIEDAGFIIHPTIFGWAFGSGFPKATRIDTQVDAHGGKDISWFIEYVLRVCDERGITRRELTALFPSKNGNLTGWLYNKQKTQRLTATQYNAIRDFLNLPFDSLEEAEREVVGKHSAGLQTGVAGVGGGGNGEHITAPATPLARAWAGHRYGLQALKPAVEPIIVAQKPYSGKPVDCITRTGAGALNVDGGRIGTSKDIPASPAKAHPGFEGKSFKMKARSTTEDGFNPNIGRWPANFILLDEEAAAALDRQSGDSGAHGGNGSFKQHAWMAKDTPQAIKRDDSGGASRFFYNVQSQLDAADPIIYRAKASRRERDAGLDGLPEREDWAFKTMGTQSEDGIRARGRNPENQNKPVRNHHPTVKPIDLARYLATLLLPPAEYAPRRILVPFSGVGSEMIGALLAGWEEVVGIEQDAEYADIARRRIEHWTREKERVLL